MYKETGVKCAQNEHIYEIQDRDGLTVCTSPMQQLRYSDERLKQIIAVGYRYRIDGKTQRNWKGAKNGTENKD